MRPNGRTIYKVLMRNRVQVFWGRRAMVTVRLPLSVISEPRPSAEYQRELGESKWSGCWVQDLGDGTERITEISNPSSGGDPRRWTDRHPLFLVYKQWDPKSRGYQITTLHHADGSPTDEVVPSIHVGVEAADSWGSYTWWQGQWAVRVQDKVLHVGEILERGYVDPAVVAAHRARTQWYEHHFHDGCNEDSPALQAFLDAASWAKTYYHHVTDSWVYLTYSVKWLRRDEAKWFCSDLKRAFREAKKHGVDAKLIR